jgi:tRNA threonylcarbamoyladenosine biosynthesis protein TsaE
VVDLSLAELEREAGAWWRRLPRGGVLWLSGDLGTGKTTFVQALARAAGATPARSPTFALVHEYPSPEGSLIHVDCFRLKQAEEAMDLDLVREAARARLLVIEWPERAGPYAPGPDAHLRFAHCEVSDRRRLEVVE